MINHVFPYELLLLSRGCVRCLCYTINDRLLLNMHFCILYLYCPQLFTSQTRNFWPSNSHACFIGLSPRHLVHVCFVFLPTETSFPPTWSLLPFNQWVLYLNSIMLPNYGLIFRRGDWVYWSNFAKLFSPIQYATSYKWIPKNATDGNNITEEKVCKVKFPGGPHKKTTNTLHNIRKLPCLCF